MTIFERQKDETNARGLICSGLDSSLMPPQCWTECHHSITQVCAAWCVYHPPEMRNAIVYKITSRLWTRRKGEGRIREPTWIRAEDPDPRSWHVINQVLFRVQNVKNTAHLFASFSISWRKSLVSFYSFCCQVRIPDVTLSPHPCFSSVCYSPLSHRAGPGSIPG
jgi:hypothetical protein